METMAAGTVRALSTRNRSLVVQPYSAALKEDWDSFIRKSSDATFLFYRDYMEYHADRFTDHSLLIYRGADVVGVLPANLDSSRALVSHEGLTYGGLVMSSHAAMNQ